MKKKRLPFSKVYQQIEPGPVVLLTTAHMGKQNVMTMSWHMMIDFEPPILACIVSNQNYSFSLLKKSKECVINLPTVELAKKVVSVGNTSGRDIDKFEKFNLTCETATQVKAPLLSDCFMNLECKVIDAKMSTKYNMFILEVVEAWIRPTTKRALTIHHTGFGKFVIDGRVIKLPSKMR